MSKVTELVKDNSKPATLSTGIRAILKATPALLIEQAQAKILDPPVPTQKLKTKDGTRDEPNPNHPDYFKAKQEVEKERIKAGFDVMCLFGVELVDPIPDDGWEKNIRYMERLGHIDLGKYDLADELDREFIYKRYIAVGGDDLAILGELAGISTEDVEAAKSTFPGPA